MQPEIVGTKQRDAILIQSQFAVILGKLEYSWNRTFDKTVDDQIQAEYDSFENTTFVHWLCQNIIVKKMNQETI